MKLGARLAMANCGGWGFIALGGALTGHRVTALALAVVWTLGHVVALLVVLGWVNSQRRMTRVGPAHPGKHSVTGQPWRDPGVPDWHGREDR